MEKNRLIQISDMIYQETCFDNIDDMLERQSVMQQLAEENKEILSVLNIERNINIDNEKKEYTYSEFAIKKFALN